MGNGSGTLDSLLLPGLAEEHSEEVFERNTKLRLVAVVSLAWVFVDIFFAGARYYYAGGLNFQVWRSLFYAVAFLALYLYTRRTLHVKRASLGLNALLFTFILFVIWHTGGAYSSAIFLTTSHAMCVFILYGRKPGFWMIAYCIATVIGFAKFGEGAPPAPFYENPISGAIGRLLIFSLIIIPALFILKQKDVYQARIKLIQRKKVSYFLLNQLREESMSRLKEGAKDLDEAIENQKLSGLENVSSTLRDLDKSMKRLSKAVNIGDGSKGDYV